MQRIMSRRCGLSLKRGKGTEEVQSSSVKFTVGIINIRVSGNSADGECLSTGSARVVLQ